MKNLFIAAAVAIASLVFLAPPGSAQSTGPASPDRVCEASTFKQGRDAALDIATLISICNVMSADDARALVDRFTSGGRILREQNGTDFNLIPQQHQGSFEVVVCNLAAGVRANIDLAPTLPRGRGIPPKQCAPFLGVIGLGVIGGREVSDTNDNGSSGQKGWFGVYLYRAMP